MRKRTGRVTEGQAARIGKKNLFKKSCVGPKFEAKRWNVGTRHFHQPVALRCPLTYDFRDFKSFLCIRVLWCDFAKANDIEIPDPPNGIGQVCADTLARREVYRRDLVTLLSAG